MRLLIDNDGETILEYETTFPNEGKAAWAVEAPTIVELINEAMLACDFPVRARFVRALAGVRPAVLGPSLTE